MFDKMIIVKLDKGVERGFRLDQVIEFYSDNKIFSIGLSNGHKIQFADDDVTVNMLYMLMTGAFDWQIKDKPNRRVLRLDDLFNELIRLQDESDLQGDNTDE